MSFCYTKNYDSIPGIPRLFCISNGEIKGHIIWDFDTERRVCFRSQSNSLIFLLTKTKKKNLLLNEDCYIHMYMQHFSMQIVEGMLVKAKWFKLRKISKDIIIQESIHIRIQSSSSNETGKTQQLKLSWIAMSTTTLK